MSKNESISVAEFIEKLKTYREDKCMTSVRYKSVINDAIADYDSGKRDENYLKNYLDVHLGAQAHTAFHITLLIKELTNAKKTFQDSGSTQSLIFEKSIKNAVEKHSKEFINQPGLISILYKFLSNLFSGDAQSKKNAYSFAKTQAVDDLNSANSFYRDFKNTKITPH